MTTYRVRRRLSIVFIPLVLAGSPTARSAEDEPGIRETVESKKASLRPIAPMTPRLDPMPEVDLVRLRLLRNETLRWQLQAQGRNPGPAPDVPAATEDDLEPGLATIIPDEDSFEDWAFGGARGETRFRAQLDRLLEAKLREVESLFMLAEPQRKTLRLAARGDLQRLLDLVEDARREFERSRTELNRLSQLRQDLRLVELRVANGLFDEGSLHAKTLRKLLDEGRLARRPAGAVH